MEKIVVTGAGGFIGYNLCRSLAAEGDSVVGVDLHYPGENLPEGGAEFEKVTGDFRDPELMGPLLAGASAVFHLASAHLAVNLEEEEYWDVNVHALPAFLALVKKSGVRRFVHASSVGVYGRLAEVPADEKTPCAPQSTYGETKLAGERVVLEFGRAHGFAVVVIRPAWVYGPLCPRTLKIYRALSKRRFVLIGKGDNLRHPLYITDMVEAFRRALTAEGAVGKCFVIAGERAITVRELLAAFASVLGVPAVRVRIPYRMGRLMALCIERLFGLAGAEPPVSRRTLEFFDTENAFDISKAKTELGFTPAYSFEEGLRASRAWLRRGDNGK